MSAIPFLSLAEATSPYADRLKEAAARVIDSGYYLNGPETRAFESELSALHDGSACVGVSNGLDALRLIFRSLIELGRLREGDGVIVPGGTYIASVMPLTEFRLRPIFIDSDPRTLNMDTAAAAEAAPHAKALLTVHLYGTPCWDGRLVEAARRHNLIVVEDNAQAIGAVAATPGLFGSHATGALGHAAAFSFYPTKNVGALGDAGAVTTRDPELAATVRALANYGSDRRYHNIYEGYNCRIDELQAAFLRVKLAHLDQEIGRRNRIAAIYRAGITNPHIIHPGIEPAATQVWHQYVIRTRHRDALRDYLHTLGIGTDIHYEVSPTRQPCYARYAATPLPATDAICATALSLPVGSLTEADAHTVAAAINAFTPTE